VSEPRSIPGMPENARCSLDGVRIAKDGRQRVVDAKTAGRTEVRFWGEPGTDEVPQYIIFQQTVYVGEALKRDIVDEPCADIAALVAGDLAIYTLPFDVELFEVLVSARERFWVDHVLPRKSPPLSEPHADLAAISALYPKHEGEARHWDSLQTEEQRAVAEWLRARKKRQEAEALEKAREAEVRMLLATTPELSGIPGELGGGRVTWRQNKPSKVTEWHGVAESLRASVGEGAYKYALERFTTTKEGARPLVVRQKEEM